MGLNTLLTRICGPFRLKVGQERPQHKDKEMKRYRDSLANKPGVTRADMPILKVMHHRMRSLLAATSLTLQVTVSAPAQETAPAQEIMTALPCVPDCRGVDLANTTLTGVNLNRVDLVNADLSDATLIDVSLVGADLTGASLFCANLIDSDLTAATLTRADMRKVDLSGKEDGLPPVLVRAVLIGADLSDANLNGVDLRGADLSYTTMARTYLGSAILNGATMVDIRGCDDSGRLPGCYLN